MAKRRFTLIPKARQGELEGIGAALRTAFPVYEDAVEVRRMMEIIERLKDIETNTGRDQ